MKNIIFIFILNLVILSVCQYFELNRGYFNLDFLFASMFLFYNKKIAVFIIFFAVLFLDILNISAQIFPFIQLSDLLYIIKFLFFGSMLYLCLLFALLLFLTSFSFIFIKIKVEIKPYLTFIMILLLAHFINLYMAFTKQDILYSSTLEFIRKQNGALAEEINKKNNQMHETRAVGVTKYLYKDIETNGPRSSKILLVVNESLGLPKDKRVLSAILKPIIEIKQSMQFYQQEQLSWNSATVYAELRELCRAQPDNLNLKNITKGFENCLPNLLSGYGYKSYSFHAALGSMYDRSIWYKKVGFHKSYFYESKKWQQHCYSFPGGCDEEYIADIEKIMASHDKQFIYWLTLNTHSPYDLRDLHQDVFNCRKYNIELGSQSCRNFKLQSQFFKNLSTLLKSKSMKGVEVFIIGDHTPPILSQTEKKKYFDNDAVVALHFKIRN